MKPFITIAFFAITTLLSAQSATEKAVIAALDNLKAATDKEDFSAFQAAFTEDALIYGTDPGEAPFEAGAALQSMKSVFESDEISYRYELTDRDIIVLEEGKSALAIEQGQTDLLAKNIQFRSVYHFANVDGKWLCDFYSVAMIPKNADLPKLDAVLGN